MKKILVLIGIFAFLIPIAYSNGGCIKIADDILVQLSSAPVVPIAGKQVSYLFSFGDKDGNLINKGINGTLKIKRNDEIIFVKNFKIKDGILELKHTFKSPGLYEIFLEFNINAKSYTPEDFLIEVKEEKLDFRYNLLFLIIGIFIGIVLMKLIKK